MHHGTPRRAPFPEPTNLLKDVAYSRIIDLWMGSAPPLPHLIAASQQHERGRLPRRPLSFQSGFPWPLLSSDPVLRIADSTCDHASATVAVTETYDAESFDDSKCNESVAIGINVYSGI